MDRYDPAMRGGFARAVRWRRCCCCSDVLFFVCSTISKVCGVELTRGHARSRTSCVGRYFFLSQLICPCLSRGLRDGPAPPWPRCQGNAHNTPCLRLVRGLGRLRVGGVRDRCCAPGIFSVTSFFFLSPFFSAPIGLLRGFRDRPTLPWPRCQGNAHNTPCLRLVRGLGRLRVGGVRDCCCALDGQLKLMLWGTVGAAGHVLQRRCWRRSRAAGTGRLAWYA